MKNTLNLVGDGDDVDVAQDVEDIFAIKLTDAECERIITVGQLHDLIEEKNVDAIQTEACLSQAAFYRLRRALKSLGVDTDLTPQTPISILEEIKPRSIRRKWWLLARSAGLDLPGLETPFRSWFDPGTRADFWLGVVCFGLLCTMPVGVFAVLNATVGFSGHLSFLIAAIAALVAGAVVYGLWHLLFATVPRRLVTVGDLAREAAGASFAKLFAEKQGSSRSDRWFALQAILRDLSGYKAEMTRDTTFFANTPPRASS